MALGTVGHAGKEKATPITCPPRQGKPGPGCWVPSPAHEVHLAPTEDIQDEALIGVRELHILQGVMGRSLLTPLCAATQATLTGDFLGWPSQ
jgi:hypothetical protein